MTQTRDDIAAITEDAYVFGFPMLMGYRFAYATFLNPDLPSYRGPVNQMHGRPVTLDHHFRDVITPNADTPYSMAALDLAAEPVVLEVPAVADRYYVMQFVDLFGTNAHYVGTRTTGPDAGTYLLVGPRFDEATPEGFTGVLRFETDLVFVVGRTQMLGGDDADALRAIMEAYRLTPLSVLRGGEPMGASRADWPTWIDDASRDERFVTYLNTLLTLCPMTHPSEAALFERFARIGIGAGLPFDAESLSDDHRAAMRQGVESARAKIAERVDHLGEKVNGWLAVDAFGDRDFYAGDYLFRAAGAMAGWGGNDAVEAFYPMLRVDSDGNPLSGDHVYRMTLPTMPPARAFWSVTMYDTSYDGVAGYLVENPIDRYLINSSTEGLVLDDGGSLTIHVQHDEPDSADGRANWLPAPAGTFYLAMRLYWPKPEALDGRWQPPPVERR